MDEYGNELDNHEQSVGNESNCFYLSIVKCTGILFFSLFVYVYF